MNYSNRVSFRKTFESTDRDNDRGEPESTVWHHTLMCGGSISVQRRKTGYSWGVWDTETAYTSPCGGFWLATGNVDIRDCLDEFDSEEGMIQWVIDRADSCTGQRHRTAGASLNWLIARENWRPK